MRFWLATLLSVVFHLLLCVILLQQKQPLPQHASPPIVTAVLMVSARDVMLPEQQQSAEKTAQLSVAASSTLSVKSTPTSTPTPTLSAPPSTPPVAQNLESLSVAKLQTPNGTNANLSPQHPVAKNNELTENTPKLDMQSLYDRAAQQVLQRPLSDGEVQGLTMRQSVQSAQGTINRSVQPVDPTLHRDVLVKFENGRQLVKVGKNQCVLADEGADLQRDIHSMKNVPCSDDPDQAMYQRIMSNVGRNPIR